MPVLVAVRARLEQQCHLGSQERDAIAVAGDVGERSPDVVCAPVVNPEGSDRAGQEHLGGQRGVLAVQDEAVEGGDGPPAGRPGTGLPVAADELDVDLREVGPERVLIAFEQHDVDVSVVTRNSSDGEVDGPAPGDPVGNGQIGQQGADGKHRPEADVTSTVHQEIASRR